jgi:hypothetical protein
VRLKLSKLVLYRATPEVILAGPDPFNFRCPVLAFRTFPADLEPHGMAEPTLDARDWIPEEILNDPRCLVRECDGCEHMRQVGLCGADRHPSKEWAKPEGCPEYTPLSLEPGGDNDPEDFIDYS